MFQRITPRKPVVYNGRTCDMMEFLVNTSIIGPRVVVRRWRDTKEVEIRAIRGDGRNPSKFRQFEQVVLLDPSEQEVAEHVKHLAQRWFTTTGDV